MVVGAVVVDLRFDLQLQAKELLVIRTVERARGTVEAGEIPQVGDA